MGPYDDLEGRILETDCIHTVRASQSARMTNETEVVMTACVLEMHDARVCEQARAWCALKRLVAVLFKRVPSCVLRKGAHILREKDAISEGDRCGLLTTSSGSGAQTCHVSNHSAVDQFSALRFAKSDLLTDLCADSRAPIGAPLFVEQLIGGCSATRW
jgi:hypothetical protein